MMRVIFLLLLSSIAFQSNSQTWNNYLQKRFKSYGIWADSILLVPNDTSLNKTGFAIKGSTAYIGDGTKWTAITGGSSVVDSLVFATKANVIKVRDSLLAADNFWSGVNTFLNTLNVSNDLQLGAANASYGNAIFYNANNSNKVQLFSSDNLAKDVSIELPTSSGKLALTTDIAIVDTSIISTKAYVNYKDDIQQGYIDMRKLESDSSADNGYTSRGRLKQYGDSLSASQAVINGVQNDTLNSHKTQILANQNATNTNAANINLKVNIADTLPMLAGYKVASILTSGTLDDARLSSNVPLKNTANTFTENQTISKSNPQVELVSATTAKASLLRGETTNTFSLTNDVLEIGGALSNCISFNNANQYIGSSPTGITGVTQWTVSFWINRTTETATNVIYFGDGTNNYQITICCGSTGYLGVYYNGTINNWFTTSDIATSGWQHFVVTKDASNILRIYINGALNNTPANAITNISNISSFRIGNVSGLPNVGSWVNAPTNQRIDQVLFYNTALTLGNVQSIYASGTGTTTLPSTGNLLLRYELNEGTGTTTVNQGTASTGNGTLVNGVVWNIATGKIPTEAATQLGTALQVRDGVLSGERGQYRFGDPFGGTILRGRSIKFQVPLETQFSFIHDGTSTLIDPANTNTSATGASTVSVVGNASIGENVAAPTNGLRVKGNGLFQANTFFGGTTTPTARVHVLASSTSASGGQIKLIGGGSAQTVTEDGTINYIGNNLEFAQSTTVYKLAKTLQNSATLDFGSTASLSTTTLTITVTGVADGDQVSLGVPNGSMTAGLIYFAWVSAADTVSIQCYNSTLGAIDPASGTFKISVIKQ